MWGDEVMLCDVVECVVGLVSFCVWCVVLFVVWFFVVWCSGYWRGVVAYGRRQRRVCRRGMAWYGVVWRGMVWCGVVW